MVEQRINFLDQFDAEVNEVGHLVGIGNCLHDPLNKRSAERPAGLIWKLNFLFHLFSLNCDDLTSFPFVLTKQQKVLAKSHSWGRRILMFAIDNVDDLGSHLAFQRFL